MKLPLFEVTLRAKPDNETFTVGAPGIETAKLLVINKQKATLRDIVEAVKC